MKKYAVLCAAAAVLVLAAASCAWAVDVNFNFLNFARLEVLPDYHPTVTPGKAQAEFEKSPYQSGSIVCARVRIFYSGWLRKHSMLVNLSLMETEAGRMIKAEVLEDTNGISNVMGKKFKDNNWILLSELGWNQGNTD